MRITIPMLDTIINARPGVPVFVLKFLQARDPAQVGKIMFARYDPSAAWLDDLRPAFGAKRFCFEKGLEIVGTRQYG